MFWFTYYDKGSNALSFFGLRVIDSELLLFPKISEEPFYPLVAPFLEDEQRKQLAASMLNIRLSARSRKKSYGLRGLQLQTYRFCPLCWAEQNEQLKGDCGWLRMWQIPELALCPKHGVPLWDTGESFRDRHGVPRDIACDEINLDKARPLEPDRHAELLLETARDLMTANLRRMPSQTQWAVFWEKKLADMTNSQLADAAAAYWGTDWLLAHGFKRIDKKLLQTTGRRIWWKNLLLLKAADPTATLRDAINEAAWTRKK